MQRKKRILLSKIGLDGHDRGIKILAKKLSNAGVEVVYLGLFQTVQSVVSTAVQEDVDVIGISTYCGGELVLAKDLIEVAKKRGIKDRTTFLMGGIFPPSDMPKLKSIGFGGLFPAGTTEKEIVSYINDNVKVGKSS